MTTEEKKYENNNNVENVNDASYRALMNAEIQASAARQNALKYTQNQLNQTGYGTQGLAQSTNLGIANNYRNAMVNAQNQYNTDVYNQQVEDNKTRYSNLTSLLDSAFDENNNVDIDAYRRIMGYEGATFDENGNADVSNMRLNPLDKESLLNQYRETLESYNDKKNKQTASNNLPIDNEKTFETSSGDVISFLKGSNANKNFYLIDQNGNSTEWELGSKYTSYPNRLNSGAISVEESKHANGDIWLSDNGKNLALVVKDQKGVVRMVEGTYENKDDSSKIIDLFNKYTDLNLQFDTWVFGNVFIAKDKDGNQYKYTPKGDGSITLEKINK